MTSGILQLQQGRLASPTVDSPQFRPFASTRHHVTKGRYITSNDPRGYIPVYEYSVNGQWIMMDMDDGYVLWTGIWKALGNSKADIVKMIESQPELAPHIRRVRGGYLKIQGTWLPYEVALRLSRRVAWPIRDELVPLFGPTFPSTCLLPDQPGYGQVVTKPPGRRPGRRASSGNFHITTSDSMSHGRHSSWTVFPANPSSERTDDMGFDREGSTSAHRSRGFSQPTNSTPHTQPSVPPVSSSIGPYISNPASAPVWGELNRRSPAHDRPYRQRYSPYPATGTVSGSSESSARATLSSPSASNTRASHPQDTSRISLPPLQEPVSRAGIMREHDMSLALPPVSSLEDMRGMESNDAMAVLRRLTLDDDTDRGCNDRSRSSNDPEGAVTMVSDDWVRSRQRSLSAPARKPNANVQASDNWPQRESRGSPYIHPSALHGDETRQKFYHGAYPPSTSFASPTSALVPSPFTQQRPPEHHTFSPTQAYPTPISPTAPSALDVHSAGTMNKARRPTLPSLSALKIQSASLEGPSIARSSIGFPEASKQNTSGSSGSSGSRGAAGALPEWKELGRR